jgi:hypothetical protein
MNIIYFAAASYLLYRGFVRIRRAFAVARYAVLIAQ